MKLLITGVTGFLGGGALRGLLRDGHEVFALLRSENEPLRALASQNPRLHLVNGDIAQMERVVLSERLDGCLHFAWGGVSRNGVSDAQMQQKNVEWSTSVLNFAASHGCRFFLNAGSRQEYAPTNEPITEESPCDPLSEYGKAKLEFFCQAQQAAGGMKLIHLRIFSVYGAGDHPWSLVSSTVRKLKNGERIELGLCRHKWSFLHIDDFVNTVVAIVQGVERLDEVEIFNVASSDVRVLGDFVEAMRRAIPSASEICFGAFAQNAESSFSLIPNVQKCEVFMGRHKKVEFEEGITEL